jgi:hypothetical protein
MKLLKTQVHTNLRFLFMTSDTICCFSLYMLRQSNVHIKNSIFLELYLLTNSIDMQILGILLTLKLLERL